MDVNNMDGYKFEEIVAGLLKKMGFSVEHTSLSGDNGIDIIAYTDQPIIKGKYVVQCKRWNKPVGEPVIRDLYGSMLNEHATKGILITNASFSNKARQFADGKSIELIDGSALSKLFNKYKISINSSNTTKAFIDYPKFDKKQYLYLKLRIEDNRRERLYYDRLQQFYHSYIVDLNKYKINKSGLIDEYISFNNDYIKRFCKRTKENIERKKAVLYINAFLYLLKGNIFKSVEIYDDIGIFETNNSVWDSVNCASLATTHMSLIEELKKISCHAAILNLYSLFSHFNYKSGMDCILNKILINIADRCSFLERINEEVPPISQIANRVGIFLSYTKRSLISPKGYAIRKSGRHYGYAITIPSSTEWWSLSKVISRYYEDSETETIREEFHKVDLIIKDKKAENDAKIKKQTGIMSHESINHLIKVLRLEESEPQYNAEIWKNKGNSFFASHKYEKAIECYDKAIGLNSIDTNALDNKGSALYNIGKYGEAIECFNKAIELNLEDPKAWYGKGIALNALGKSRQKQFLVFGKSKMLIKHDKLEKAVFCFNKAIEINPIDAKAWYGKACTYSLLEDKENALKSLQQAIKLDKKYKQKAMNDKDCTNLWSDENFERIMS